VEQRAWSKEQKAKTIGFRFDGLVTQVVTPVKTGVQPFLKPLQKLDSGFCRNDGKGRLLTFYGMTSFGLFLLSPLCLFVSFTLSSMLSALCSMLVSP
jgi:hypothetical protein